MKGFINILIVFFFFCFLDASAVQLFHGKINQWKNNKYDGLWISWSDSLGKKVESKGHYKDGHETGLWKYYYDDGTLRRRERYSKNGIATKYYYPNGKLKSKGKAIVDMDKELLHYYYQGNWIYYSEEGKPVQVIIYERGKQVAERKISSHKAE